ncbi:MAG: prepilin-type N-terminal cleavage/methylation domain-containing protein [Planctomycetota bacterium]
MRASRTGRRRGAERAQAGLTLIEVMIASVVVTILILGAAAAFSETVGGANAARRMTSGVLYLETISENISAQPAANLLALDGNQLFDGTDATNSQYRVDVTVFEAETQLAQVELALFDLATNRQLGTVVTQRTLR